MWRACVATSVWTTNTCVWLALSSEAMNRVLVLELSPYTSFLDRRVSSSLLDAGTETLIQGRQQQNGATKNGATNRLLRFRLCVMGDLNPQPAD